MQLIRGRISHPVKRVSAEGIEIESIGIDTWGVDFAFFGADGELLRAHYEIIADNPVMPTSELPSHLCVHNYLIGKGSTYKATVHTHPIELVAMSHHKPFLEKDVLTNILWSMIPETKAFCARRHDP